MSQILTKSPFDESILKHNEAQLDFILEMYALDHPDKMTFTRPGRVTPGIKETTDKVAWANVLIGKALANYMADKLPNQAVLDKLRGTIAPSVVKFGPKTTTPPS